MKQVYLLLLGLFTFVAKAQLTFYSTNGLPNNYAPVHLTQAANGDVYLVCVMSAGSTSVKLMKSNDLGSNWTEVTVSGLPSMAPTSIVSASGVMLISGSYMTGGVLYQSTDNGSSWTQVSTGFPATHRFYALAKDASGNTVYMAGSKGVVPNTQPFIAKSTNSGLAWSEIPSAITGIRVEALGYSGGKLYASTADASSSYAVWSTGDDGQNYVVGNGLATIHCKDFTVLPNGNVLAIADGTTHTSRLFSTADNGANWTPFQATGLVDLKFPTGILQTTGPVLACGTGSTSFSNYVYSTQSGASQIPELALSGVKLYPCPVSSDLLSIAGLKGIKGAWYQVTAVSGQVVDEGELHNGQLDVSELPAGIYAISVKLDQELVTRRFVKAD